ncbi:hypothetical protein PUN28_001184 [Cardiocondyla obscurior]|uniref:Uncharacterized protein n=1 Tax=Cardiocondyla obscurior TaxID=286306 RepID=A0AAW2H499_9HYME
MFDRYLGASPRACCGFTASSCKERISSERVLTRYTSWRDNRTLHGEIGPENLAIRATRITLCTVSLCADSFLPYKKKQSDRRAITDLLKLTANNIGSTFIFKADKFRSL